MLTIIKVLIILFLLEGIENILVIFKINQHALLSFECPGIFSCPNWSGEKDLFWEMQEVWTASWDYPQEYLVVIKDEKVSPFVRLETILPLLWFLLDSLTNKHSRAWSSMINLWIDFRTYQKERILLLARQQLRAFKS